MKCDACRVDKTVTVTWSHAITRINPNSGRVTVETRSRTLCPPCGAGLAPEELKP